MQTSVELGKVNNNVKIESNLVGRAETFRMLALAEATGLPLLLLGPPGIGKTAAVREYAGARIKQGGKLFILETDQYTRSAELKGRPNMAALVDKDNPRYEVLSPIADADYIVINEIDKASGGLRHGLMSIMAEKRLFNGAQELVLPYKAFIATCNEIPKEEKGNALWDRFILKMKMERLSTDQLMDYFRAGHKDYRQIIDIDVPTKTDLDKKSRSSSEAKMMNLLKICHGECSDRTISYLPLIVKCVAHIWKCNIDSALVKTCEILCGTAKAKQFSELIVAKEVKNVMDKVEFIHGITDINLLKNTVHEINVMVTNYAKEGKLTRDNVEDIEEALNSVLLAKGVNITDMKKK